MRHSRPCPTVRVRPRPPTVLANRSWPPARRLRSIDSDAACSSSYEVIRIGDRSAVRVLDLQVHTRLHVAHRATSNKALGGFGEVVDTRLERHVQKPMRALPFGIGEFVASGQ